MNKNYYKVIVLLLISLFIPIGLCTYYGIKQKQSSITTNRRKPDPQKCAHPDGIDLSHHNIAYDWKKVDAKFVYVRATFGVTIKDRRYHIHRKAAERHQIPVGAYHFLTAETSAKEQFLHFSSVVKKKHIRLRPMLDVEESKYWNAPKGFSDMDAHLFIREWCDLCKKKYGVAPIIYTTEKLYKRYGLNKDFEDCTWWVANYNDVKNYEKKMYNTLYDSPVLSQTVC